MVLLVEMKGKDSMRIGAINYTSLSTVQPSLMSETTEGVNVELDELRDRLERRNLLLDVVRKAYHRDVFVIRDCLLRMRNGEPLESVLLSTSDLSSVSSIDLRDDPGFFLFSPHECELKLKPCHYCGGRFEVVHHESSRIMSLKAELECSQLKVSTIDLNVRCKSYYCFIV